MNRGREAVPEPLRARIEESKRQQDIPDGGATAQVYTTELVLGGPAV